MMQGCSGHWVGEDSFFGGRHHASFPLTPLFCLFPCYFFLLPFLPDWKRMKTKLFLSDQMQSHIFTFPDLLGKTFMSVVEPDNIYMQ